MKRTTITLATVFALTLLAASSAPAQTATFQTYTGSFGAYPVYPYYAQPRYPAPYWGYDGGYHASTAEEGILRGYSSVIRSAGEYQESLAQARIDNEEARRKYLENQMIAQQNAIEAYQRRKAAQHENLPQPLTAAQREEALAMARPKPLAPNQFNPAFGEIRWPEVLQGDEFAAARNEMERLVSPALAGGVERGDATAASQLASQMLAQLKDKVGTVVPSDYMQARNFLTSLSYEVRNLPQVEGLASN
jgi:hypothetical protein